MQKEIRLENITKRFPGVLADDHVNMIISAGTVHAVVGENGAGKSTLMNILSGLYQPDDGRILVDGEEVRFENPRQAMCRGIGMVHQEFMLVRNLTVLDNIILGFEPSRAGMISRSVARRVLKDLMNAYKLDVPLDETVERLPVSMQQRVEIVKALYRGADVLILDEPTSVLTPQESRVLFAAIRELVSRGKTVIFISHKLGEVLEVADRISVMRDGRVVGELPASDATERTLARLMVGRDVLMNFTPPGKPQGDPVLEVKEMTVKDARGLEVVKQVSFTVHAGEVLGIAGVAGNGQSELVKAIVGLVPTCSGSIHISRRDVTKASVKHRRQAGMRYIPQDRAWVGTCRQSALWKNLLMGYEHYRKFSRFGLLRLDVVRRFASDLVARFGIKTASLYVPAGTLSGGNLQKAIVARELALGPRLLIAEDPTRGIDIGATEFVRRQVLQVAEGGGAVLLVSQDLQEVMALSNRILVMHKGQIVGERMPAETTEEELGLLMAGRATRGTHDGR